MRGWTRRRIYSREYGIRKLTIGISEETNRRDVNTVRRSLRRAEPRSSDPIQRCRAATRKSRPMRRTRHGGSSEEDSARIRWSRCGLVLIGSTSWIVDDGLEILVSMRGGFRHPFHSPCMVASYFRRSFDGRVSPLAREVSLSRGDCTFREIFRSKISRVRNSILDIFAN